METSLLEPNIDIFGLGYDRNLLKADDFYSDIAVNVVDSVNPTYISSGELIGNISVADGYLQSSNYIANTSGWRLNYDGILYAVGAVISGTVSATSGTIGGWVIGSTSLTDAAGTVGISSAVTGGNDIRFWAGHATPESAPFKVTEDGVLTASSAVITGAITTGVGSSISGDYVDSLSVAKLAAGSITSKAITLAISGGNGDVKIQAGKSDFTNVDSGFILGMDDSDDDKAKFYIGDSSYYLNWTGNGLTVKAQYSNLALYDCVVDANGYGDYTTLADAVTAGHTNIYVRVGTYTAAANLSLSAGTIITGEDWDTTVLDMGIGASNYQLQLNANNIILRNIKITGYKNSTFVVSGTGSGIRVEHCKILNPSDAAYTAARGLYISGNDLSVVDSYFESPLLALYTTGTNNNIDRNRFVSVIGNGTSYSALYLKFDGADLIFTNNFITCTDAGNVSVGVEANGDRSIIANNKLNSDKKYSYAIYVSGADSKVVNNHIIGFDDAIVLGSEYRQVCSGNTVYGCGGHAISTSGLTNTGYGYKTIIGNVVYSVDGNGIVGGPRTVVSGNTVYAAAIGISGMSNNWYLIITDNEVGECTDTGIEVSSSGSYDGDYCVICNNRIESCTNYGIHARLNTSTVLGNVAHSNGTNYSITDVGTNCDIAHNIG